ncbi:FlaD/FlaE family flagellar protein [Halocatena halophila]|uniref:FlaD/FlaE family flagellar protein n=1 Tax=Halocatena halophila TaxID=2814576 RepID=UPI002ED01054
MVVDSSDLDMSIQYQSSGDTVSTDESSDAAFVFNNAQQPDRGPRRGDRASEQFNRPEVNPSINMDSGEQDSSGGSSDGGALDGRGKETDSDTAGGDDSDGGASDRATIGPDVFQSSMQDGPTELVAIDPTAYSIEELRTVADCSDPDVVTPITENEVHGFVWSEPPEEHRSHVEDPTPQQIERLLTLAGIDPERVGEKPYLTRVEQQEAGTYINGWIDFLISEAGTDGAISAIDRYQEIGWITPHVAEQLLERVEWADVQHGKGYEVFDRGDHLLNFFYVAKIASLSVEGMMFY